MVWPTFGLAQYSTIKLLDSSFRLLCDLLVVPVGGRTYFHKCTEPKLLYESKLNFGRYITSTQYRNLTTSMKMTQVSSRNLKLQQSNKNVVYLWMHVSLREFTWVTWVYVWMHEQLDLDHTAWKVNFSKLSDRKPKGLWNEWNCSFSWNEQFQMQCQL